MEWLIHIEGKADERILVTFDPLDESISFYGQYKVKFKDYAFTSAESKQWVIFSEDHDAMNIDLKSLNEHISKVYDKMAERIKVYDDFRKVFGVFKTIEIKED
jgi:hypothetical protein